MTKPVFSMVNTTLSAEELADELERIANLIRNGYTSGEVMNSGWWESSTIADDRAPDLYEDEDD